jgi:hypothetical protein
MKRPTTGTFVLLVGLADVALSSVLFTDELAHIGSAGVFGTVMFDERAGPEAAAVWFAAKGVILIMAGQLARGYEKLGRKLPAGPGWLLAALGAVGAIIAPVSGFWIYLALGALWLFDSPTEVRQHSER